MSDLQQALITWDLASAPLLTDRESDAIVDAARKYANPDINAARDRITPMIAEMLDDRGAIECAVIAQAAVVAALGITEEE